MRQVSVGVEFIGGIVAQPVHLYTQPNVENKTPAQNAAVCGGVVNIDGIMAACCQERAIAYGEWRIVWHLNDTCPELGIWGIDAVLGIRLQPAK